jgi:glutaconate CoA-transferase subunit A
MREWMEEWVYECPDRDAYLTRYIQRFGVDLLNNLKAKPYYSAPANYGSAFTSSWNDKGEERIMGVTLEELERIIQEKGLFHE